MINMKDYVMWLDDRGIATWDNELGEMLIPEGVNIYDPATVDEYKNDAVWNGLDVANNHVYDGAEALPGIDIDDDDDMVLEDDEDEHDVLYDDEDPAEIAGWTPHEFWFEPDGGLTADAVNFLYNADIQGELI